MTNGYYMEMLGMRRELGVSGSMGSQLRQAFIPLLLRSYYLLSILQAITTCEFVSYRFFPKLCRRFGNTFEPLHGLEMHLQFHKIS